MYLDDTLYIILSFILRSLQHRCPFIFEDQSFREGHKDSPATLRRRETLVVPLPGKNETNSKQNLSLLQYKNSRLKQVMTS